MLIYIPNNTNKPDQKYCMANGLLKKIKEKIMLTAFRQVVTVAAAKAPQVFTNVSTI